MNGLVNTFGLGFGLTITVLSGIFAYTNRDRYRTLIKDIYEPGNQELRQQIITERQRSQDLTTANAQLLAQVKEKDSRITDLKELNSNLPNYTALNEKTNEVMSLMSNNHTIVMKGITDLAKSITGKVPR